MKFDVFGLGNALMDVQVFVNDDFLKKNNIPKGVMHLIDEDKSRSLIQAIVGYKSVLVPGGSSANTISALAMLGKKTVFSGVVADDTYGRLYESKVASRGVKTLFTFKDDGLTGSAVILTSEDSERTMLTHLGVCREGTKDDVDFEILADSKIFHCEGYQWDTPNQKETVVELMKFSNKQGLKVSFDLADPFCIERNVKDFNEIITSYVDILFGNKDEVKILTGESDPVEGGKKLMKMGVEVALVKVGGEGSLLFYKDKIVSIPVYKTDKVLDSTGCGDTYAAGFLYGYSSGKSNESSAKFASYLASKIIEVPGAQYELLDFNEINKKKDELFV